MKDFRADLHIHSNCSDGTDDPMEILEIAKKAELSGLSITDHDTILAYTPAFFEKAKLLQLEIIKGVEISSEWLGSTVHVLAYGFKDGLQVFLDRVLASRIERNRRILEKLKKKGILIEETELHSFGPKQIVGRPHIAQAMLKKKAVMTTQEAYDRYLKDDACCYASGGKFTPKDVIDAIHQENGLAILAHPHFLKKGSFMRDILQLPFDGLECYYGRLLQNQELPWVQMAKEKKWLLTGGSDYHGSHRPGICIGCSWVDEPNFRALQSV